MRQILQNLELALKHIIKQNEWECDKRDYELLRENKIK